MQNSEPAVPKSEPAKQEATTTAVGRFKKQNSEPAVLKYEPPKQEARTTPQRKVDYATDLFNLLCMDDSRENGSKAFTAEKSRASLQRMSFLLIICKSSYCYFLYIFPICLALRSFFFLEKK